MNIFATAVVFLFLVTGSIVMADESLNETDMTTTQSPMMSDGKSAEINLPGFGEVDLDRFSFKLPSLSAPSIPTLTMPNISFPSLPALPKFFSEVPCVSLVSARAGTCRKSDECVASSGFPDGPCALGLGVCCTKPFTCGNSIFGNVSVIANPNFPEHYTGSDMCAITIIKSLNAVQIRLDLEVFDIAGSDGNTGACSEDAMEVTGANVGTTVPRICGMNNGQHIYIHVDKTLPLSPVQIKFTFAKGSSASRLWKIRVTQLGKDHPILAPAGCTQYLTGSSGIVRSFNYEHIKNVGIRTIKGQSYGVCFRKEAGFCSVRLDPTFTRVARSAQHYAPQTAHHQYGYFPAQRPIYYQRPVYLNRPIIMRHPQYPQQYQQRPVYVQRPAVAYYPTAPVAYYYPVEEKKEVVKDVIEDKKEALEGLLAKKKLLIEELFSGLRIPIPAAPVPLEELLAKVPSLSLPILKKEVLVEKFVTGPYGEKIPVVEEKEVVKEVIEDKKETLEGLLAKKKLLIEDLFSGLQIPIPATPVLLEELLSKVPSLSLPIRKKEVLVEKKYVTGPYGEKIPVVEEKKEVIHEVIEKLSPKSVVDVASVPAPVTISGLQPMPKQTTILTSEPFAILVDTNGEEMGRGFSLAYTHQSCA